MGGKHIELMNKFMQIVSILPTSVKPNESLYNLMDKFIRFSHFNGPYNEGLYHQSQISIEMKLFDSYRLVVR